MAEAGILMAASPAGCGFGRGDAPKERRGVAGQRAHLELKLESPRTGTSPAPAAPAGSPGCCARAAGHPRTAFFLSSNPTQCSGLRARRPGRLQEHETMAIEQTLSIIKPDGVAKGVIGKIISRFETNGLKPVALRMEQLSQADAEGFYAVHKERGFFGALVKFMTSGPVLVMCLEGESAVLKNRADGGD